MKYVSFSIFLSTLFTCKRLWAWFEASGVCYTIRAGSSPGLLLGILLLPGHGDPAALHLQAWSLHALQQFIDGVDVGVGQPKALDLGLGGS